MQVQPETRQTVAPPQPTARSTALRLPRLLLRRAIYSLVWLGRALRPVLGAVLVGFIALIPISYLSWQLWGPKPSAEGSVTRVSIPAAPAVQNYMEGRKSFNADVMWDSFSPTYQNYQLNTGASKETMQSQAAAERTAGVQYSKIEYIGGVKTEDGGGMYFYAVDVALPTNRGTVSMVITTDAKGKVDGVITPFRVGGNN